MNANVTFAVAIMLGFTSILFLLGTAFTKLSIVFLILRNALGLQQAPTNSIIFSLAIIMAIFISLPVISATFELIKQNSANVENMEDLVVVADTILNPLRVFLTANTNERELKIVYEVASTLWKESQIVASKDNILIQITSFTLSELTRAFEIGFILFLPFVVIDLVVTTILMALGMMMVSPTILSIPFKLLLFIAVGGWAKLFGGLSLGYVV